MTIKPHWDQYGEYLGLEKILGAQSPKSAASGQAAHDEMLFIQFHQIYELWFKQILFELDDITERLSTPVVDESQMQPILIYLGRIVEILKQMEGMIDVLETMPPQSFVDFREYLGTASGFQSTQFRLIETRLGLKRKQRLCVFHADFDERLKDESKQAIRELEKQPSLYERLDDWLSRTPFTQFGSYAFANEYRSAVNRMFDEKTAQVKAAFTGEALAAEMEAIASGRKKFEGIFDEKQHAANQQEGRWRMSWKALQAALFIMVYRNEPVLQAPYTLLMRVMDVDELLARWRLRHALMVQRMVGMGMGTGGSSGYAYLMNTVETHRIFTDLFALASYLIPTNAIPALPADIRSKMQYQYAVK